MDQGPMTGRVALITGAAGGIGSATAKAFAKEGVRLVLTDVQESVTELAEEIQADGVEVVSVVADISALIECNKVIDCATETFGRLDYAFNNAGISGNVTLFSDCTEDDWDRMISVNLTSVFHCMRLQIPKMIENGGGVIVNTSSIAGVRGLKGFAPYVAAKHGVKGLSSTAALDYADAGIRCLSIGPGFIETPMTQHEGTEHFRAEVTARIPQARTGQPGEVADLVVFLCSDRASYLNGAYIPIDGALTQQ